MNIADVLTRAAALVREDWWQGGMERFTAHSVCASLAIGRAARYALGESSMSASHAAHEALLGTLGVTAVWSWGPIYTWNDAPGQTAENVAVTLELAAIYWAETQHTMRVNGAVVTEQELLAEVPHA